MARDEKTLKQHLEDSEYQSFLKAKEILREVIDVDIPALLVTEGMVNGSRHSILTLVDAITFWNRKKGGYSISFIEYLKLRDIFLTAWRRKHHSALGLRNMFYGGEQQLCIYVVADRRRELDARRRRRERDDEERGSLPKRPAKHS